MSVTVTFPERIVTEDFSGANFSWLVTTNPSEVAREYKDPYWLVLPNLDSITFPPGFSGSGLSRLLDNTYTTVSSTTFLSYPAMVFEAGWTPESLWEAANYTESVGLTWAEVYETYSAQGDAQWILTNLLGVPIAIGEAGSTGHQRELRKAYKVSWRMKKTPGVSQAGKSSVSVFAGSENGLSAAGGYLYPSPDSNWHKYEFSVVDGDVVFKLDDVVSTPFTNDGSGGAVNFSNLDAFSLSTPGFYLTGDMIVDDYVIHYQEKTVTFEQLVVPGVGGPDPDPDPDPENPPPLPITAEPLVWDRIEDRGYEYGIDHGVFYPRSGEDGGWYDGVVWNGLASVDESVEGGAVDSFFIDGEKYLTTVGMKEYKAVVRAYSPPPGFEACDGIKLVVPGFLITGQSRDSFGFSYRTMVNGEGYFKIHLVYNATANPASSTYQTNTQSSPPEVQSWGISAIPPDSVGYSPTAHFVIDTSLFTPERVAWVESQLYGSEDNGPYLPPIGLILENLRLLVESDPE